MSRRTSSYVSSPGTRTTLPADVREWIAAGRHDVPLFARRGLGIELHEAQIEAAVAFVEGEAAYYELHWANRAGKTTLLMISHMHRLFYKLGIAPPASADDYTAWVQTDYRTLHCAPLNDLASAAHSEAQEIIKGTSKAQRDPVTGTRRPAPLAPFFVAGKERNDAGQDRMLLRCTLTGAATDFRSTEGKAARLEGRAWRFITWDEWPQTENTDDIRYVLMVRLTNRAADYDAPIVLTGTITPETEHIAKEWIALAEDPAETDWWGNSASRSLNPSTSGKSLDRALRNLDAEDYSRAVLGLPGGVKSRLIPSHLVDPIFRHGLPRLTLPEKPTEPPTWEYLHVWDLAIAEADNVGMVLRVPADWKYDEKRPIVGCELKIIPGSHTLTDDELIHAIESMYLPYRGRIVVDATDAHGKNVYRLLRRAGYKVEPFVFNERDGRGVQRKDMAIDATRDVLTEGMRFVADKEGKVILDDDGVAKYDPTVPYGALWLPADWHIVRDQLSILRENNTKQRKDAAMVVLMACEVAFRIRRAKTHRDKPVRFAPFAGRRYLSAR